MRLKCRPAKTVSAREEGLRAERGNSDVASPHPSRWLYPPTRYLAAYQIYVLLKLVVSGDRNSKRKIADLGDFTMQVLCEIV